MTTPIGGDPTRTTPLSDVLGNKPAPPAPTKEIDKDAFLKLLVAQLKYQDPMNPAQGTEFLSQTAQFTQVEKLTDMADVTKEMLTAQLTLGASSMIGKTVTYTDGAGNATTGKVTGATLGSSPSVTINGMQVPLSSVTTVGEAGTSTVAPGAEGPAFTPVPGALPAPGTPTTGNPTSPPTTGAAPPAGTQPGGPPSTPPAPSGPTAPGTPTAPTTPTTGTAPGTSAPVTGGAP